MTQDIHLHRTSILLVMPHKGNILIETLRALTVSISQVTGYLLNLLCGGPKSSFIVQIIYSFWSFDISGGILRNQKIIIGLVYLALFGYTSLCNDYPVESCKIIVILSGSMLTNL